MLALSCAVSLRQEMPKTKSYSFSSSLKSLISSVRADDIFCGTPCYDRQSLAFIARHERRHVQRAMASEN